MSPQFLDTRSRTKRRVYGMQFILDVHSTQYVVPLCKSWCDELDVKMLFNHLHSRLLSNRRLLVPETPGLNSTQFQADRITDSEWSNPAKFNGLPPENPKFASFSQDDSHEIQKYSTLHPSPTSPLYIHSHSFFLSTPQFLKIHQNLFSPFLAWNCLFLL